MSESKRMGRPPLFGEKLPSWTWWRRHRERVSSCPDPLLVRLGFSALSGFVGPLKPPMPPPKWTPEYRREYQARKRFEFVGPRRLVGGSRPGSPKPPKPPKDRKSVV